MAANLVSTPVAATLGGSTALPIITARKGEMTVVAFADEHFDDNEIAARQLPADTQFV